MTMNPPETHPLLRLLREKLERSVPRRRAADAGVGR